MLELVHHEKVRDCETGSSDRISPEEMQAFTGTSVVSNSLMVCPALLQHVKEVVEVDAAIMKVVRKAREERELRRGPKKGPKDKNQQGGG